MSGRFYYVLNTTEGGKPHVRHSTEGKARAEAARLARVNPGNAFIVLEAKASYIVEAPPSPPVKVIEYHDLRPWQAPPWS